MNYSDLAMNGSDLTMNSSHVPLAPGPGSVLSAEDLVTVNGSSVTGAVVGVFSRMSWEDLLRLHRPLALYVDRVVTPCWYLVGVAGNLLSALVWLSTRMRRNNSSAVYLITLALNDLVFLLLHILQELQYSWDVNSLGLPVLCEGYFVLMLCAQYLSPVLVLGFTVERYIAVCCPFQRGRFCTTQRAIKVVIALVWTCLGLALIQSYFWMYDGDTGRCIVRRSALVGGHGSLWSIWTWVTEMLVFLLVPLVILAFNVLVIREVRHISRSGPAVSLPPTSSSSSSSGGSAATTVMLLSVSFYVILTTLPATLVYALVAEFPEGDHHLSDLDISRDRVWSKYFQYLTVRKVVEELCLSHYACNFFLYFITGTRFRQTVIQKLRCRRKIGGDETSMLNGEYTELSLKVNTRNTLHTVVSQM